MVELLTAKIKEGGHLDYEEYWDRSVVGTSMSGGHYVQFTGYGNYGSGGITGMGTNYGDPFYLCRSGSGTNMGTGGCLTDFNSYGNTPDGHAPSMVGAYQRYGEYAFQFWDMNSDKNNDTALCAARSNPYPNAQLGDSDCNGNIRGDDDDENIGMGPTAFTGGASMKELYLIKSDTSDERTYFRYIIRQDPDALRLVPKKICNTTTAINAINNGCIGNIQMIKLIGRDLGMSHSGGVVSVGQYDGTTDTWVCNPDFPCARSDGIPSSLDDGWVDVFPTYINIEDINFFPFPSKDPQYAWKEPDPNIAVSPYVRMNIRLGYAESKRIIFKTPTPEITISTTVSLSQ